MIVHSVHIHLTANLLSAWSLNDETPAYHKVLNFGLQNHRQQNINNENELNVNIQSTCTQTACCSKVLQKMF